MKTALALVSTLVFAATAACAQAPTQGSSFGVAGMETSGPSGQQKTATIVITPIASCPVSMQARQGGLWQMVKTRRNAPEPQPDTTPKPSQQIHLVLQGFPKDKRVVSAMVTARGLSARDRIDNLNMVLGEESSDLHRTLNVAFAPDENGGVSADIDLPAFTAVNSLRLESIIYADGSKWEPAKQNMCTVTPDRVMLIAGH